jgi:hypothetical protein
MNTLEYVDVVTCFSSLSVSLSSLSNVISLYLQFVTVQHHFTETDLLKALYVDYTSLLDYCDACSAGASSTLPSYACDETCETLL